MPSNQPRVTIQNARFNFRNFSGKEDIYGKKEKRFGVILDQANAIELKNNNWPVKFPDPREEGEERDPYIVVSCGYKLAPPRVVMISSGGPTDLGEDQLEVLDWVDIQEADVIFQMGHWEVGDKTGTKAWLKTLVVTIEEDELELKHGLNQKPSKPIDIGDAEVDA